MIGLVSVYEFGITWPMRQKENTLPYEDVFLGFLGGSDSKESARNAGDLGLISRSGRSPGEENGSPHQYSCLENAMDRGAWWL